jgi:hypothetical protein
MTMTLRLALALLVAGLSVVEPFVPVSHGGQNFRLPSRCIENRVCRKTVLLTRMKLDVAPQVVAAFPTAKEQNECLAVVNAAVAALNKSDKVCHVSLIIFFVSRYAPC